MKLALINFLIWIANVGVKRRSFYVVMRNLNTPVQVFTDPAAAHRYRLAAMAAEPSVPHKNLFTVHEVGGIVGDPITLDVLGGENGNFED